MGGLLHKRPDPDATIPLRAQQVWHRIRQVTRGALPPRVTLFVRACYNGAMEQTWPQRDALKIFRIVLAAELVVGIGGLLLQMRSGTGEASWYSLYLASRLIVGVLAFLPLAARVLKRSLLAVVLGLHIVLGGLDAAIAPLGLLGFWSGALDWDGNTMTALQQVPAQAYLLLIPTTLLAWGYGRRGALYGGALAMLMVLLGAALSLQAHVVAPVYLLSVAILVLMLNVLPTIVSVLAEHERQQRAELESAYHGIRRHAAIVEQLAVSRERNRLARELHDTLAHSLSAIAVQLEALRALLAHNPQAAEHAVGDMTRLARSGLADVRHAIQELRSDPVQTMGLEGALREMLSSVEARTGLVTTMTVSGHEPDLTLDEAGSLYRIAEEALLNAERHAAASRLALTLDQNGTGVRLVVADDGRGFDQERVGPDRYGLMGMRERAALIGADLVISSGPDQGTRVECTLSR